MNNLRRKQAPISTAAWQEIDKEATRVLKLRLAGRKLVDFNGPLGTHAAAVNTGRVESVSGGPVLGVSAQRRQVQSLVELRTPFDLNRDELDAVERGAKNPDLAPLVEAATRMAQAEDTMVFHGYPGGGIQGIDKASVHAAVALSTDYEQYPRAVSEATRLLRVAGVDGPYGIALGPRCYSGIMQATAHGGYPILELLHRIIDGPVVWAPAVNGAIVLSLRGGDYELTVGQDLSIGYISHTDASVRLYLTESVTFQVLTAEAAVALVHSNAVAKETGKRK